MSLNNLLEIDRNNFNSFVISKELKNDNNSYWQFRRCVDGGEGKIQCVVMIQCDTNEVIGFIGLTQVEEDFGDICNMMFNVEYVYMSPQYRGHKLSQRFLNWVEERVNNRLDSVFSLRNKEGVILLSTSSPMSDAGDWFVQKLNEKLEEIAGSREIEFTCP